MPPAPSGETISYGPSLVPEVSATARNYSLRGKLHADVTTPDGVSATQKQWRDQDLLKPWTVIGPNWPQDAPRRVSERLKYAIHPGDAKPRCVPNGALATALTKHPTSRVSGAAESGRASYIPTLVPYVDRRGRNSNRSPTETHATRGHPHNHEHLW